MGRLWGGFGEAYDFTAYYFTIRLRPHFCELDQLRSERLGPKSQCLKTSKDESCNTTIAAHEYHGTSSANWRELAFGKRTVIMTQAR